MLHICNNCKRPYNFSNATIVEGCGYTTASEQLIVKPNVQSKQNEFTLDVYTTAMGSAYHLKDFLTEEKCSELFERIKLGKTGDTGYSDNQSKASGQKARKVFTLQTVKNLFSMEPPQAIEDIFTFLGRLVSSLKIEIASYPFFMNCSDVEGSFRGISLHYPSGTKTIEQILDPEWKQMPFITTDLCAQRSQDSLTNTNATNDGQVKPLSITMEVRISEHPEQCHLQTTLNPLNEHQVVSARNTDLIIYPTTLAHSHQVQKDAVALMTLNLMLYPTQANQDIPKLLYDALNKTPPASL